MDLSEVHGLTFEVPREKILAMLEEKAAFLDRAAAAWLSVTTDEAYLDAQTANERGKAAEQAKAQGLPPQMAPKAPAKEALIGIAKKNVRTMQSAAGKWRTQKEYLSSRAVFTLTQEHLMSLALDDADKMYPPEWKGATD